MNVGKTIVNLQKQNDSIYHSLLSKNINFERICIDMNLDESEQLKLLGEENAKLKELVKSIKSNQSIQSNQQKQKNLIADSIPVSKSIKLANNDENNENDEETYIDPIKKFNTITNMEEIKRAFFNGEFVEFEEKLKSHPFKYFKANYKYNSDKDGAPEYSATNLLKGFVRSFDDYRKYFMICFRCWKSNSNTYLYNSYWIVNSNEPICNIIGLTSEDFEFELIDNLDYFSHQIKKKLTTDSDEFVYSEDCKLILIGENYVH